MNAILKKGRTILKSYSLSLIFMSLSVLLYSYFINPKVLAFNKEAILQFEIWRWFSAHFTHADLEHLTWNLCAMLILSIIIESYNKSLLIVSTIVSIFTINTYLWFNEQLVSYYVGFSGVLNTLLVVALYNQIKQVEKQDHLRKWIIICIFCMSLLKIFLELFNDISLFSSISWQALPQAHLIGFFTGTIMVIVLETKMFNLHPIVHHKNE